MLIPSYRPEWGKYTKWSYKSPDRVERTEEERRNIILKKERDKLREEAKMSPHPIAHDHASCTRVKFNVNGRIFETQLRTLNRFPETLLGSPKKLAQFYDPDTDCYFFDRMPSSFEAILYFFQSGGYLRRPENIHLDIFYDDAEFFGLPQSVIANFKLEEGVAESPTEDDDMPQNLLQRKIWLLFDYPESSIQARILAICSVFVIVLSIIIFCVETIPEFHGHAEERTAENGAAVQSAFEPMDFADPFFLTETICSIWFSTEYLVRFVTSPNKWDFVRNLQNIIDLVSVFPYFLTLATYRTAGASPEEGNKGGTASLSILRVIRLVRVFRIFKLSRHSRGLKILGLTLKSSMSELFLLIFFVFLGVIMFSSCIYFAEQGDPNSEFTSIPRGFWYAVITMTTVGYGETVPQTVLGKLVGSLCAITGVLTIALPVPVIVSNFNYFYHQSIDEQQFNFAKLNHVENCPYRPAGGDGVLPGSRDEEEDEIDWQPEVGVKSDEDIQTIFD
ncbi:potassium voltage-gated channel protein Shaker [Folsomia candida]|nr:potassium voltage-gated channel protein Shaker [Folsomia candida]